MKKALYITLIACFILGLPLSSFAGRRADVEEALDEWTDYAEDEGYEVLQWDIDEIEEGYTMTYTLELEDGDYWIVAESDNNIIDLDLAAYYEDDYEDGDEPFASDTLEDNYPILEFELDDDETVIIEVSVYEFDEDEEDGYYCILMCED